MPSLLSSWLRTPRPAATADDGADQLLRASMRGDVDAVRRLLGRGVAVDAANVGILWTALHGAAAQGHAAVAAALLDDGATADARASDMWTPLHLAADQGRADVVKLLLDAHANATLKTSDGRTALDLARANAHTRVALLLDAGGLQVADTAGDTEDAIPFVHSADDSVVADADPSLSLDAGLDWDYAEFETSEDQKSLRSPNQQLRDASYFDDVEAVKQLLNSGRVDVNTQSLNGRTPLHSAVFQGNLEIINLLLEANCDVNARENDGWTPMHWAVWTNDAEVAMALIKGQCDVNAQAEDGSTPLHVACRERWAKLVRILLENGSDVNARDKNGRTPLHSLLLRLQVDREFELQALDVVQDLILHGARWDKMGDEMIANGETIPEARSLKACALLWEEECKHGQQLTLIPIENVRHGAESTQKYIADLRKSENSVLRRKICVVGPGSAGKTSLIKSLTNLAPSLEHLDDRTIGIDQFLLQFDKKDLRTGKLRTHEVTFWDFAGQYAYQVVHSLFFSRRTLFLLCIDLDALTTAIFQATLFMDDANQVDRLMDEFINNNVLHWVCIIFARQPDAEFVFIATKEDLLAGNAAFHADVASLLKTKLAGVGETVRAMRAKVLSTRFSDRRTGKAQIHLQTARGFSDGARLVWVSCKDQESVRKARSVIEEIIVSSSDLSYAMPDTYSHVLSHVITKRENATLDSGGTEINKVLVNVETLCQSLESENLSKSDCRVILQTFHDLGDILWYEDLGVDFFRQTVILDPMLLIDLIRQVINHKQDSVILPHEVLRTLPFWNRFEETQMAAMKEMLQRFDLVLPTNGRMRWDSDLIVPAYWQSKTRAAWLFGGDLLRLDQKNSTENDGTRVQWEYLFITDYPDSLVDHLVVASYSPFLTMAAGPDWILYEKQRAAACRIMASRDSATFRRTLRLEAVLSESASPAQTEDLWDVFRLMSGSLERVLHGYKGLVVSRSAIDDRGNTRNLESLCSLPLNRRAATWMPPEIVWEEYIKLLFAKQDNNSIRTLQL